jgi:GntR family transcriptional regulator, transcriptional repressor for pyruvate dehydrogenase complex
MERSAATQAVFEPVAPPTTFEETVERLGVAIRVGLLAPGSRLPPEHILAGLMTTRD